MLTVIPVSQSDKKLIPQFLEGLKSFPPGLKHEAIIVTWPDLVDEMTEFCEQLKQFFDKCSILEAQNLSDQGHPVGGSLLFKTTCQHVHFLPDGNGWLWMELDTVPLKPSWLTTLEASYYLDQGAAVKEKRSFYKFMGVRENTLEGYGGELQGPDQAGTHMAPVGIYPSDIFTIPVVNSLGANQRPFYYHIQWYSNVLLNDTNLIQNNRSTVNYRKNEGEIECDSVARNPWEVHWNKPIRNDAVLLHGVKDDSLLKLIAVKSETTTTIPISEISPSSSQEIKKPKVKKKIILSPEVRRARAARMRELWRKKRELAAEPQNA